MQILADAFLPAKKSAPSNLQGCIVREEVRCLVVLGLVYVVPVSGLQADEGEYVVVLLHFSLQRRQFGAQLGNLFTHGISPGG